MQIKELRETFNSDNGWICAQKGYYVVGGNCPQEDVQVQVIIMFPHRFNHRHYTVPENFFVNLMELYAKCS